MHDLSRCNHDSYQGTPQTKVEPKLNRRQFSDHSPHYIAVQPGLPSNPHTFLHTFLSFPHTFLSFPRTFLCFCYTFLSSPNIFLSFPSYAYLPILSSYLPILPSYFPILPSYLPIQPLYPSCPTHPSFPFLSLPSLSKRMYVKKKKKFQ